MKIKAFMIASSYSLFPLLSGQNLLSKLERKRTATLLGKYAIGINSSKKPKSSIKWHCIVQSHSLGWSSFQLILFDFRHLSSNKFEKPLMRKGQSTKKYKGWKYNHCQSIRTNLEGVSVDCESWKRCSCNNIWEWITTRIIIIVRCVCWCVILALKYW